MSAELAYACFDRVMPRELAEIARVRAIQANSANASPFEAAAIRSKCWSPGQRLRISFLDGSSQVQDGVMQIANRWMECANIHFDFGDYPDATIRISFNQVGSWSALGTDALVEEYFAGHEPTMNFGWLKPETPIDKYSGVVLHEFGHALGMIHEHQSPDNGILWNRAAVIGSLSGPPNYWTLEQIEFNMFERYDATQTQFTEFDPKSIMLYEFPKEWTLNEMEFPENIVLSETDKLFIAERYPH